MQTVLRNIRELTREDVATLERVVGISLDPSDRIVIQVLAEEPAPQTVQSAESPNAALPDWCNVYSGLTTSEVDEIDALIRRSTVTRAFED
jgi:hypothetical protein